MRTRSGRQGQVPKVVEECLRLLREKGLSLEGVMRVAGSNKRIQEHKLAWDLFGSAALDAVPPPFRARDTISTFRAVPPRVPSI